MSKNSNSVLIYHRHQLFYLIRIINSHLYILIADIPDGLTLLHIPRTLH
jgi:hypothetical protein